MRRYWLILVLPVLLLLWWGWGHRAGKTTVHFVSAGTTTIESTISTNGKVEPAEWGAARAETAGVVRSISVQRGQTVTAGQTLVNLDTTAAQSDLAEAEARRAEAQAESATLGRGGKASQLASLTDSIGSGRAAVAIAQRTYDSLQKLEAQQAATKLQVLEARDSLDRAKLNLGAFQNQRETLVTTGDKAVAAAKLDEARAAVALAQHKVRLGVIAAPVAGTVYQFDLKVGAYLQPGDLVAMIGKLDQVKVTVFVDEPDLGRLARDLPVTITWDARPNQRWAGRIDKLPTAVVAQGTRTVGEVTTIVDNPDHDLLPGVTVNANIVSKTAKDVVSIPKGALRTMRGQDGVYRLKQGDTLEWVPVKTGISDVNDVQILSGIRTGDLVADRVIEPADAEIANGMSARVMK